MLTESPMTSTFFLVACGGFSGPILQQTDVAFAGPKPSPQPADRAGRSPTSTVQPKWDGE